MAELDRRFTFQIDGGRPMRGTPEAHPDGVPHLTPDGAVPDEGAGVALLAKPVDVRPCRHSRRLEGGVHAKQPRRRIAPGRPQGAYPDGPPPGSDDNYSQ